MYITLLYAYTKWVTQLSLNYFMTTTEWQRLNGGQIELLTNNANTQFIHLATGNSIFSLTNTSSLSISFKQNCQVCNLQTYLSKSEYTTGIMLYISNHDF